MLSSKCHPRSLAAAVLLLAFAVCAHGRQGDTSESQRLFVPWSSLALDLELKGLVTNLWDLSEEARKEAGANGPRELREFHGVIMPPKGSGRSVGFLKIRLEPAAQGAEAAAARDAAAAHYARVGHVSKGSIKPYEYKLIPLLKFKIEGSSPQEGSYLTYTGLSAFPIPGSIPRPPTSFQVLEAYVVRGDLGITFRYAPATSSIKEKDEQVFQAILDSLKFVDASAPSSSYDHFALGNELYKWKRHAEAAAALERALALEQKERRLTQPQWRQMVMALANSRGATDDVKRARDVLEYGVAAEPTYPYFHHGLARLHSYLGDLDRALASLDKAYQFEPKSFRPFVGFPIPDPLTDPAFQRYKDEPGFRDAVKALKKKYKR